MKVSFDSNAYRRVTDPSFFSRDAQQPVFQRIHDAIKSGQIIPLFSETIATLEGVTNAQRGTYFAKVEAAIDFEETPMPDGSIHIAIKMGPNNALHPGVPPVAEKWLKAAVAIGFRFMRAPRIGTPSPPYLNTPGVYADNGDISALQEVFGRISREIEARGVGIAVAKTLGQMMCQRAGSTEPWFSHLDQPKDAQEERSVQRAIGEWADGDTAAAHVGYEVDVLCTEDQGNSAGTASIFDPTNRAWLASAHNVDFATLSELGARL